jgi:hypothetical protein
MNFYSNARHIFWQKMTVLKELHIFTPILRYFWVSVMAAKNSLFLLKNML